MRFVQEWMQRCDRVTSPFTFPAARIHRQRHLLQLSSLAVVGPVGGLHLCTRHSHHCIHSLYSFLTLTILDFIISPFVWIATCPVSSTGMGCTMQTSSIVSAATRVHSLVDYSANWVCARSLRRCQRESRYYEDASAYCQKGVSQNGAVSNKNGFFPIIPLPKNGSFSIVPLLWKAFDSRRTSRYARQSLTPLESPFD